MEMTRIIYSPLPTFTRRNLDLSDGSGRRTLFVSDFLGFALRGEGSEAAFSVAEGFAEVLDAEEEGDEGLLDVEEEGDGDEETEDEDEDEAVALGDEYVDEDEAEDQDEDDMRALVGPMVEVLPIE